MENKHQEDLKHIRQMMERSTRFMSLSGLSGISVGVVALLAALFVFFLLKSSGINYFDTYHIEIPIQLFIQLFGLAVFTLCLAALLAFYFTWRKGKHLKERIWNAQSKRMVAQMLVPIIIGGVLSVALVYHQMFIWVAPITLIFYGLGLINAARYTFSDILYLGVIEIILGFIGVFFLGYGLLIWAVGFGLMHIIYGFTVYFKYDKA